MAYKNNIPQATDQFNVSQADIKNNFEEIKTLIDIDHITFGDANQGKHSQVTFPVDTLPVTAANEVALFCKNNASGDPALWFVPESAGTEVDFTTAQKAATGYTTLPSGILLNWGTGTATGAGTTFTFAKAFGAAPYSIQLTTIEAGFTNVAFVSVKTGTVTTTNFQAIASLKDATSSGGESIYYLAIGKV